MCYMLAARGRSDGGIRVKDTPLPESRSQPRAKAITASEKRIYDGDEEDHDGTG
jgi:hypothetical protein